MMCVLWALGRVDGDFETRTTAVLLAMACAPAIRCYLLLFRRILLRVDSRRLVAGFITARTIPVAQHTDRHGEQYVRYDQRQYQVLQIVIPGVASNHYLRVGTTVVAWERFPNVGVTVKNESERERERGRSLAIPTWWDVVTRLQHLPTRTV